MPSPKIKIVPQKKSDKHASPVCRSENQKDGGEKSPRAVLFPQMQSRTPTSPNLVHSKPDKRGGSYSPLSSPQLSKKSPRNKNVHCGKISPLATNVNLNLDDPEDFPPMDLTPRSSSRLLFMYFISYLE